MSRSVFRLRRLSVPSTGRPTFLWSIISTGPNQTVHPIILDGYASSLTPDLAFRWQAEEIAYAPASLTQAQGTWHSTPRRFWDTVAAHMMPEAASFTEHCQTAAHALLRKSGEDAARAGPNGIADIKYRDGRSTRTAKNREESDKYSTNEDGKTSKIRQNEVKETMKSSGKNQRRARSHSVSEAATLLGVSIPTLKRMAEEGRVESFRTPGGHLRIQAESREDVREHRQRRLQPVRDASPVLQNRREQLGELTLEAQVHRARRELARLRQEEQEETERQEAEMDAREQEAAQREAELEIDRERLRLDRAKEAARRQAQEEMVDFRHRWSDEASAMLAASEYKWLHPSQRNEILEGLEAEVKKRGPADKHRMAAILTRHIKALIEPFRRQRETQEKRQRIMQHALIKLPYLATESEKVRVTAAVRDALRHLDADADECEMRVLAQEAMQPTCQAVEKRLLDERLIEWGIRELPYWGRSDRDEARLRRECAEILEELPADTSEVEAKEALEPAIQEVREEIEERQARKQREEQKEHLIEKGVAEITQYLWQLKKDGEISPEDYLDYELRAYLQEAVRAELESEISGEETAQEVKSMVHEIVEEEIE